MEMFITHDESSPPVPFHLAASKVIIVSTPLRRRLNKRRGTAKGGNIIGGLPGVKTRYLLIYGEERKIVLLPLKHFS